MAKKLYEDIAADSDEAIATDKHEVAVSLFGQAEKAIEKGGKEGLLTITESLIYTLRLEKRRFFFEHYPKRILEVLFWALAATLVRLIFNAGKYLYDRSFYTSAIPHHIALIFTVPLLAVVIAFVLSLIEVSVSLSEVELKHDLNNVPISIIVGAVIGLAPWKAWEFMQTLADLLFGRLTQLASATTSPGTTPPPDEK